MNKIQKLLLSIVIAIMLIATTGCEKNTQSIQPSEKRTEQVPEKKKEETKLNNTYTTTFGKVNQVTYPSFQFDYSDMLN